MKNMAPAEATKMMKDNKLTFEGYMAFWRDLTGGQ